MKTADTKKYVYRRATEIIGSRRFLVVVLALFAASAAWLAFNIKVGVGYDELYHFTIVSAFQDQILPFIATQNPAYDAAGDITRLPSYFYHYIMSWPGRVLSLMTDSVHIQVFVLRLFNIGFFVSGLVVFWYVLKNLKVSRAIANTTIFLITLLPMSPALAATINYDNLLFPIAGLAIYVFVRIINKNSISITDLLLFVLLGLVGAIVKYTFLPLYAPLFIIVAVVLVKRHRRNTFIRIVDATKSAYKKRHTLFIGLSLLTLLAGGLFIERYGVNLVKYQAVSPKCEVIMSADRCEKYFVWTRNNDLYNTRNEHPVDPDVFVYQGLWAKGMQQTLFFPYIITDDSGNPLGPLPLTTKTFRVLTVVGLVFLLIGYGLLRKDKARRYVLLSSAFFVTVLFIDNYSSYITYQAPVATNGRYLLVVFPILIALSIYVAKELLHKYKSVLLIGFVVASLLLMQGGGVVTNIMRGQPSWFWNEGLYNTNETAKRLLSPVVDEK